VHARGEPRKISPSHNPAIEQADKALCPFFLLAPIIADLPRWRGAPFFISATTLNALLYAFAAWNVMGLVRKKSE